MKIARTMINPPPVSASAAIAAVAAVAKISVFHTGKVTERNTRS
jgi:hypothetical protein